MLEGKVTKWFPLKFKDFSEDKKPRLPRFAPSDIKQFVRFSFVKEHKTGKGGNMKQMEFELLGIKCEADGVPLSAQSSFSHFKFTQSEQPETSKVSRDFRL